MLLDTQAMSLVSVGGSGGIVPLLCSGGTHLIQYLTARRYVRIHQLQKIAKKLDLDNLVTIPQGRPISISVQWNLATTGGSIRKSLLWMFLIHYKKHYLAVNWSQNIRMKFMSITCKAGKRHRWCQFGRDVTRSLSCTVSTFSVAWGHTKPNLLVVSSKTKLYSSS